MTDAEARSRLLKALDDAHTFDELCASVTAAHGAGGHALFEGALRFLEQDDSAGLDDELQERFARALSRFVESRRALHLAGLLEGGSESA